MSDNNKKAALDYHRLGRPGKIETLPTKPYSSQHDLSLAYSPGVAYPCLEIKDRAEDSYEYTNKGNLMAVISNGTAVLGLGDIGALAGKPVMEGKALLFKIGPTVQDIRRTGLLRHRAEREGSGEIHRRRQGHSSHLRRHQPRGHQGPGVFRDRAQAQGGVRHPRDARRPARHGHHLSRRPA